MRSIILVLLFVNIQLLGVVSTMSLFPAFGLKKSPTQKNCIPTCKLFSSLCKNNGKCKEKKGPDCKWYCECPANCEGFFCEKLISNITSSSGKPGIEVKVVVEKEKKVDITTFDKSKLAQALHNIVSIKKKTEDSKPSEGPQLNERIGKTLTVKETITGTINCPPDSISGESSDKATSEKAVVGTESTTVESRSDNTHNSSSATTTPDPVSTAEKTTVQAPGKSTVSLTTTEAAVSQTDAHMTTTLSSPTSSEMNAKTVPGDSKPVATEYTTPIVSEYKFEKAKKKEIIIKPDKNVDHKITSTSSETTTLKTMITSETNSDPKTANETHSPALLSHSTSTVAQTESTVSQTLSTPRHTTTADRTSQTTTDLSSSQTSTTDPPSSTKSTTVSSTSTTNAQTQELTSSTTASSTQTSTRNTEVISSTSVPTSGVTRTLLERTGTSGTTSDTMTSRAARQSTTTSSTTTTTDSRITTTTTSGTAENINTKKTKVDQSKPAEDQIDIMLKEVLIYGTNSIPELNNNIKPTGTTERSSTTTTTDVSPTTSASVPEKSSAEETKMLPNISGDKLDIVDIVQTVSGKSQNGNQEPQNTKETTQTPTTVTQAENNTSSSQSSQTLPSKTQTHTSTSESDQGQTKHLQTSTVRPKTSTESEASVPQTTVSDSNGGASGNGKNESTTVTTPVTTSEQQKISTSSRTEGFTTTAVSKPTTEGALSSPKDPNIQLPVEALLGTDRKLIDNNISEVQLQSNQLIHDLKGSKLEATNSDMNNVLSSVIAETAESKNSLLVDTNLSSS